MLQMGDTVGPRYTAAKISAISYLSRTFSLLIMGDTERPRYTGFRGLLVRGITALQYIIFNSFHYCIFKILQSLEHLHAVVKYSLLIGPF